MRKDFKTGMVLGLVLAIIAVIGLSTRPGLSIKARTMSRNSAIHRGIGTETVIGGNTDKRVGKERPEQQAKAGRFHIVSSGETLSDISRRYYGSVDKWQKILNIDGLPIENPGKLRPGTKLIIPE